MSEYVPYFRTDEATIGEMTGTDYAERMETATYLEGWKERSVQRDDPELDVDLDSVAPERSEEYASRIIHAVETDTPRRMNLNVSNGRRPSRTSRRTSVSRCQCSSTGRASIPARWEATHRIAHFPRQRVGPPASSSRAPWRTIGRRSTRR